MRTIRAFTGLILTVAATLLCVTSAGAQDYLPRDNGLATYHTFPRYRESESHPFRMVAYVLHPVGWALREGIFRPWSYFVSSSETRASVFGYREPYDYREPECFSADGAIPDCRSIMPFNYDTGSNMAVVEDSSTMSGVPAERHVYFPDVNFDFDVRNLNTLGRGKAHQIAKMLETTPGVHVVLEGHADYRGSEEYNEKLGMDRAESVRQELVALGVPADKVSTVTFGKSKPIFEDQADWATAVNRRVEVRFEQPVAAQQPNS